MISGQQKFAQDVQQNLLFDPRADGTGAGVNQAVGYVGDVFSIRAKLSNGITNAFNAYAAVQSSAQKYDRLPNERFSRVANIQVYPSTGANGNVDPTTYVFRVDVLSVAGDGLTTVTGVIS